MWLQMYRGLAECVDLLLPPACLLCGRLLSSCRRRQSFCPDCLEGIIPLPPAHCLRCAQPFPNASSSHLCGCCLQRPPDFSVAHAARSYHGSIKQAVHKLKYRDQLPLAEPLGQLLADAVEAGLDKFVPDCIVPVPLYYKRLQRRGYNQALELSKPVAKQLQRPINTNLIQRTRNTPQQQGLPAADRRKNLRNAFTLASQVPSLRILVIDDVMTTGETLRECSRILKAGGAAEIQVAVVGRA